MFGTKPRFRADKERQERALEKRKRQGLSVPGEQLTRQEREARMWAFMYELLLYPHQTAKN